ncbi:MAG TPA: Wzz/FepE/Etk N-terminal domain-containing protein [Candidatus Micrarchaeaceae archaeon]|nr:Wzz/FepE/Etk N-terminal domain-containing protein [Candidatus Micrarchaeaceae archaeon]
MDELAIRRREESSPLAVSVRDAVAPVFRQRRIALWLFAGIFFGALLAGLLAPRKYEAEMKILVNRERVDPVVTPDPSVPVAAEPQAVVTEEDINSEVELLKSRDLLEQVVRASGIEDVRETRWSRAAEYASDLLHGARPSAATRLARDVQTLENRLVIDPLKKTTLIRVSYASRDPQQAARVLQTLAALYQEKHAAVHRPPGTFEFFDQEANHYREELATAESGLIEFNDRQNVIDAGAQKQLVLQQLSQFESEMQQASSESRVMAQRAAVLERLQASSPTRQATGETTLDNAPLLAQLEGTLLGLELKRSEMVSRYAPEYPPMQDLERQIGEARSAVAHALQNPIRQATTDRPPAQDWLSTEIVKAEADQAQMKAEATSKARVVELYESEAHRLDQQGAVQQSLLRNVKTAEDSYLLYVRKREDARISDALDSHRIVNVSIAEAATVPAYPALHLAWILIGGLFAASVVSIGGAVAVDRLDPRFRTPEELGRYLDTRVLAAIPRGTNDAGAEG